MVLPTKACRRSAGTGSPRVDHRVMRHENKEIVMMKYPLRVAVRKVVPSMAVHLLKKKIYKLIQFTTD